MKILITGAKGFVGKNLVECLKNIRDGKDRRRSIKGLLKTSDLQIISYDSDSSKEDLIAACQDCDFVFNLAGINRSSNVEDFRRGNIDFVEELLSLLKEAKNTCPVVLASSVQASLNGINLNQEYGLSKQVGESLLFDYSSQMGAKVLVYRFPNIFGKWCRPNYNSVVATFCYNIANDLPIVVTDRNTVLELVYIDDLIDEMLLAISDAEHRCDYMGNKRIENPFGKYCFVPGSYMVPLGDIADCLENFDSQRQKLIIPNIPDNSFEKKLYSTYLSYLPASKMCMGLNSKTDERGSFTEIIKTVSNGQISVNIMKPGVTKGKHWHNSKCEIFVVVSGKALIKERKVGTGETIEMVVSGDNMHMVHMLPGYTHSITNLSDKEDLITLMWVNEIFDREHPDTFSEEVNL